MTSLSLKKQAKEIERIAEDSGVQSNYLFVTTFNRYQVQLDTLDKLEEALKNEETLITKEYVRDRPNTYINPAIAEYNRTTDSANKTVSTLMKIIRNFGVNENTETEDPLMKILNGGN